MTTISKHTQALITLPILFAVLCILLTASANLYAGTGIQLLLTGEFHGDEVSVKDGEVWTGLYKKGAGFELRNAAVTVESIEDVVLDKPGQKTGKLVGVKGDEEPVFLIRGLPGVEEGPVVTRYAGWDWLKPGVSMKLGLLGKEYTLYVTGEGEDDWNIKDYRLLLASGGKTQELARYETCCDDTMPAIIWAGDLDRDGVLDFYLDLSDHYNMSKRTLFLSSLAGNGEIVGKAAELVTTGC